MTRWLVVLQASSYVLYVGEVGHGDGINYTVSTRSKSVILERGGNYTIVVKLNSADAKSSPTFNFVAGIKSLGVRISLFIRSPHAISVPQNPIHPSLKTGCWCVRTPWVRLMYRSYTSQLREASMTCS